MKKIKFALFFAGLAGLAGAAPAAWAQASFYFGGSVGNSQAKQSACTLDNTTFACDRSDTNFGGNMGFMFNPNWGIELGFRDLRKVTEQTDALGDTAIMTSKAGDAVIVAAVPFSQIGLGDRMSVYGKAGGYYAKTKVTSNFLGADAESKNKQWTYGLGVRYDIFRHLGLTAEWQRYNNLGGKEIGVRTDVDVFSGGFVIAF